MAREDPQLKLRLPEELKVKLADAARENGRSVNAEIVARLVGPESSPKATEAGMELLRLSAEIGALFLRHSKWRESLYKQILDIAQRVSDAGPDASSDQMWKTLNDAVDIFRRALREDEVDPRDAVALADRMNELAERLLPSVPDKF